MQVAIDLPNDFVAFQAVADIRQEIRNAYALCHYQRERVSLAKAAEIAGLSLYDFMSLRKSDQFPVIDVSRDEFMAELAGVQRSMILVADTFELFANIAPLLSQIEASPVCVSRNLIDTAGESNPWYRSRQ